jgi:hypothetical protein
MLKGLALIGSILAVIGILLVFFFWPIIGYETKDSFDMEDVKEGETIRYVGSLTNVTAVGGIYVLELDDGILDVYTKEMDFKINDNTLVTVTIVFGKNTSNWDENQYHVQKIPTTEGYLGLIVLILGLSVLIAGLVAKKSSLDDLLRINAHRSVQPSLILTAPSEIELHHKKQEIEKVTCPKCENVFGVEGKSRPAKISCPKCGLEGILD